VLDQALDGCLEQTLPHGTRPLLLRHPRRGDSSVGHPRILTQQQQTVKPDFLCVSVSPANRGSLTFYGEASPENVMDCPMTPPDLPVP
jgi:hypothetical protein